LKTEAADAVTLEISGADGRLVRRYSSDDEIFKPNAATIGVPLYWFRDIVGLSAAAGMHRFTWDLHYQPLDALDADKPAKIGGPTLPIAAIRQNTVPAPTTPWVNPGTFTVKLCVNGGTTSPLCITKTVIISPKPAVPIVSGPTTTCQNPGPYCVTNPQSGVTYTWSATNGTPAPVTGTCTSIQWSSGSGIVAVTATNAAGCKVTKRFEVLPCNPHNPCCEVPSFKVVSWQVQLVSGNYVFTPVLSTSVPVKRVVVDLISANITYASSACGTPHTYPPGISAALSTVPPTTPPLNPWQPVINSSEAVWSSTTAVPLTNVGFPMNLILPPHGSCNDTIHFCVKYSVTDANCRTCEIVQCYDYTRPWGIDHPTEDSNPN